MGKLLGIFALFLATVASVGDVQARDVPRMIPGCAVPLDRVPWPFETANQKFELAEGEFYHLRGTTIAFGGYDFFEIDLKSQPWLATAERKANPYILLNPTKSSMYTKFMGEPIMAMVKASRLSNPNPTGDAHTIGLDFLMDAQNIVQRTVSQSPRRGRH